MTRLCTKVIVGTAAAVFLSACQVDKSANPLSPAVAGPIAGVVISTANPRNRARTDLRRATSREAHVS